MGYSAGNLELSVLGFDAKVVDSIDVTAKALNRLATSITKINNAQFVFAGQKIEHIFEKIASASNKLNTANLTNFASAAKSLSSISNLSRLDKMDFGKVSQGFEQLTVAISPFVDKVKEAEKSLVALDSVLKSKQLNGVINPNGSKGKKNGSLFGFAKIGSAIYLARRLGKELAGVVQAGSDYTETLNLWQVAMRNNLDMADEFISKMNKAYGMSTKSLMEAQAVYKNMIGSLAQITDETAYKLSESLVLMTADYASLYNRTIESAIQNMQSMLAGQVRPIRSAGLDITETTLYQFYQELGGTKAMRQLNRTEKQLLSILAVFKQMETAGALGDMSKTLNLFANQSRMMAENFAEVKTWSGLLLKDWIEQNRILINVNAILITISEVLKAIATAKGIGKEDFISGMLETAEATNDEIDELQGKLLGFDKFRALDQGQESTLAIDEKVLEALGGYTSKMDESENAARKLADTWLEFWLNDDGTLTEQAEALHAIITAIGTALAFIASKGIITKLGKLFAKGGALSSITKLKDALGLLKSPLFLILGGIALLYTTNEDFRDSVDNLVSVLFDALGNVLEPILGIISSVAPLLTTVLNAVGKFLAPIIDAVAELISILDNAGVLQGLIYALGIMLIKVNPATLWISGVVAAISLLAPIISGIAANLDEFKIKAEVAVKSLGNFFINLFHGIGNIFIGLVNLCIDGINAMLIPLNAVRKAAGEDEIKVGHWKADLDYNIIEIPNYATGASDIDSGTVFRAGELGKTEAVYTGSNGKTNVANVKQMEQAFFNALQRHSANGEPIIIEAYLDGEKVYENTTQKAKQRGQVWAKA